MRAGLCRSGNRDYLYAVDADRIDDANRTQRPPPGVRSPGPRSLGPRSPGPRSPKDSATMSDPGQRRGFTARRFAGLAALAGLLAAPAVAQGQGEATIPPLPPMVVSGLEQSIRAQLADPSRAKIRVIVHFPGGAGENGRICGEVTEPAAAGERVRTFVSSYTRAGRALTRFEDGPFAQFLERDSVFRNCGPRL